MPSNAHAVAAGGQAYGLLIGVGIALVVLLIRNSRARALKIERLWIRPAIFIALFALMLWGAPPPITPISVAVMVAALAIGCALGWQRGRLMTIEVHPETHELSSKASPLGMVFIIAIMGLRMLLRTTMTENATLLQVPVSALTDAFLVLVVGIMVTQGVEMWLRARKLLAQAQAAKAVAAQ